MPVRVQEADFDLGAEAAALGRGGEAGAVVTFTGHVRGAAGGVEAMTLEHYPGMTEAALGEIEAEALRRWPLTGALAITPLMLAPSLDERSVLEAASLPSSPS